MIIYCCECCRDIEAVMVTGRKVYPYRKDLRHLKFWQCNTCKNFVGCHKNGNGDKPLGVIANDKIKKARIYIHKILDPLWKSKKITRNEIYKRISDEIGIKYHTAKLISLEQAREVYKVVLNIQREIKG